MRRRHRGYNAGPSPGCLGQPQNWRLALLLLVLLLLLLVVQMLRCWCGSALRLDSPRVWRASDAAGGVAGGSDRGSTVEAEGGGCGGSLSLFHDGLRGLGGSTGRQGVNQATEDRGPSRGLYRRRRGRQIRMVFTPVGGTEASWTLSSTLAPEGRVVLTT